MEQSQTTSLSFDSNPQAFFSWKAPLRPYKKRAKKVLRFYLALALLLSCIVFFFGDIILIIPIWSILFLFYVLTITPPPEVENKLTKFGIETAGMTIRWEVLSHFYYTKRFDYQILTVVSHPPYYFHSYLVIPNDEIKKKTVMILSEHLIYQERPHRTFTDRIIDLLSHLIPDDDEDIAKSKESVTQKVPSSSFPQTQGSVSL